MHLKLNLQKLLIVFLSLFGYLGANAQTIDFDNRYGNNGNILNKIQQAINDAPSGATLVFRSSSYDLNSDTLPVIINKEIAIQGRNPGTNFNRFNVGSSGIRTQFLNGNILIRSNNVSFSNIEIKKEAGRGEEFDILIDTRHPSYLVTNPNAVTQKHYTGLVFNNVTLSGTAYPIGAGNGIGAQLNNVSFINFRRIGYWLDRKGKSDHTERITFNNCFFKPDSNIKFDDRGISLDAGNTDYPVIWDLNTTLVRNCRFEDTGIALSRCHGMTIENSTFDDNRGLVDMIHIEEFSYDVTINNNNFDCNNAQSKIIVLDRELQRVSHINITRNTILGRYAFFISAYAPQNLKITNNNFSRANTTNNNAIDLTFYENRGIEPIPAELLSNNITITGNNGLGNAQNGRLTIAIPTRGANNNLSNFNSGRRTVYRLDPPPAFFPNGVYEIINRDTQRKLGIKKGSNSVSGSIGTDNSTKWNIQSLSPYTYSIQNVENGQYLQTIDIYTEFNLFNNTPQTLEPFTTSTTNTTPKPFWTLFKRGDYFRVFAGGNERQTALATNGSQINLIFGKVGNNDGTRSVANLGNNAEWQIVPATNNAGSPRNRTRSVSLDSKPQLTPQGSVLPSINSGETIPLTISYATGIQNGTVEDLNYVAVQIRQINAAGNPINTSDFEVAIPGNEANIGTLTYNYKVPFNFADGSKIPSTRELPNGHQLLLLVFMSVNNDSGFANANGPVAFNTTRKRAISLTNRNAFVPAGEINPVANIRQVLPLNISYSSAITNGVEEDLTYVAVQVREVGNLGEDIHTSDFKLVVPNAGANAATVTVDYKIPFTFTDGTKIPTSSELLPGHQLLLLLSMSTEDATLFESTTETIVLTDNNPNRVRSISFDNRDALIPLGETAPVFNFGQEVPIKVSYNTGKTSTNEEDFYYAALQVRQIDAQGTIINTSAFETIAGNNAANTAAVIHNYIIPSTFTDGSPIPNRKQLPNGHQLLLLVFMSVDNNTGFANANNTIFIEGNALGAKEINTLTKTTENPITVYPNPTSNVLNISGSFENWIIYDAQGALVSSGQRKNISISQLPVGSYFIGLFTNNQKQSVQKFVVIPTQR
ncbi:T9SS type A sorting domain-containing protein [Aquimarina agarilytica]|uniref:T9SS type A sorting domain-containing protein n=1 Tax=Aquimarina agarilytica TaxID=1087449 RepID=UPI0002896A52|nr:T9SS type A sorting domain-containing protein [Aquimarina agarilytica]